MNKEIIATIRLAQGEGGYYDELSRIHLTAGNPQRDVLAGTNCTQLRRSVKSGRLRLLFGSLGEEKKINFGKKGNRFVSTETPAAAPVVEPVVETEVPVVEVPEVEEVPVFVEESGTTEIEPAKAPVEEEPVAEEAVEDAAAEEAQAEVATPAKKNRAKKA
jgi:hypothetical protein